jgi:hydroxypyruvate isomerase
MLIFAIDPSMLLKELPFIELFAAARRAGFEAGYRDSVSPCGFDHATGA